MVQAARFHIGRVIGQHGGDMGTSRMSHQHNPMVRKALLFKPGQRIGTIDDKIGKKILRVDAVIGNSYQVTRIGKSLANKTVVILTPSCPASTVKEHQGWCVSSFLLG